MRHLNTHKTMPLVSVVMPNYNKDRWINKSVQSVIDQTYRDWELIIVDDCSTDTSMEILHELAARDDRIRLRELPENSGNPSKPRNTALSMARGQYVAFLDADDSWDPLKLKKQVSVMLGLDNETALCYHDMAFSVHDGFMGTDESYSSSRMRRPAQGKCFDVLLARNFICNSSVMIRRSALQKQPYWHDLKLSITQDWDLWLRIAWQYGIAFIPEVLGVFRIHNDNRSSDIGFLRMEQGTVIRKWRGRASYGTYTRSMAMYRALQLYDRFPDRVRALVRRLMHCSFAAQ